MTDTTPRLPDDPPTLTPGTALAPGYEVLAHLHRSRDYDVYDVWSAERACRVVAKTPCPDLLDRKRVRRRLMREGERLSVLTHPHLARVYEVMRTPHPLLILETLSGQTLAHLIDTSARRLGLKDLVVLGVQLASVISYLHRHELLHLDLKPSNIVVEAQRVKLLDLSIARAPGKGKKGLGTRQYLAPEQARGARFTPATDVWGIGAVLYEAATGLRPFCAYEDEDHYEQLERRADGVRQHRKLHKGFAELIDSCLEPEPEQRPHVEALTEGLMRFAT